MLGGCGGSDVIPAVSYTFTIQDQPPNVAVVTSYAVANSLQGSPTILPYKSNTTSLLDIVSVDRSQNTLNYWRNDGVGAYSVTTIATGFNNPWGIMGADVDGDTITDVLIQDDTAVYVAKMGATGNVVSVTPLPAVAGFSALVTHYNQHGESPCRG